MKSGADVLTAEVRVEKAVLVVSLFFPFPLPAGTFLCFVAAFFFATPDAGALAGAFLVAALLGLAMA